MTRRLLARLAVVAVAAVALVGMLASTSTTEAAWSDAEWVTAPATSGFVQRPNPAAACSIGLAGLDVTFHWAHGTGGVPRTGYVLTAYRPDGSVAGTQTVGATVTTTSTTGLLTSLLNSTTYRVEIQAYAPSTSSWRSTPLVGTITTTALGLITSCSGFSVPA
ncbi:hypothetical protein [Agrococcus sp. SGAir0287]|uniref:hypothetical protein n=1 Tax=Agrococcus sp. SGAir0287 TaxID=2070347 RepID=UPI0010CD3134|nr:hypothetical protein [Agrococcus sp. SGAir0287]QCR19776.1 hypothetical protein C1N71_10345 [Agrococcus sp. SGAir0287]